MDLMLEIMSFCVECWEHCSGCGDDGCSFYAAWVTECSGEGDEVSVDLVAEYGGDVDLATVVETVDLTTFSLGRAQWERLIFFL